MGMSTGKIHTFAERQPEYISTMSQMSQASRGGGSAEIANAINTLNYHVARLSAANANAVLMMTKNASQVRNNGAKF